MILHKLQLHHDINNGSALSHCANNQSSCTEPTAAATMEAIKSISIVTLSVIALLVASASSGSVTKEQMQQATEPVRLVCAQKSKVSEESLARMRSGALDEAKEFKCYVNCVFDMMQMVSRVG
jgi:hypothetical protein